jgi:hypothetical protein
MLLKFSTKTRKVAVAAVGAAALTTIAMTSGMTAASAKAAPSGAMIHGSAVVHHLVQSKLGCAGAGSQDDSGDAFISQDFTDSGLDAYDAQSADDFVVNATCKIHSITAYGQYFNGVGPADSENVTIYSGKKSPGSVVKAYNLKGADAAGTFTFTLKNPLKLKPGHYWLSVQAVMAFGSGGEWGWEATSTSQYKQPAQFQNPGDGFGTGCTTWMNLENCLGNAAGPDLLFSLS